MCELFLCNSGEKGKVPVNENIGDGSWLVWICEDCADKLNLSDFDDLPNPEVVESLLLKV